MRLRTIRHYKLNSENTTLTFVFDTFYSLSVPIRCPYTYRALSPDTSGYKWHESARDTWEVVKLSVSSAH